MISRAVVTILAVGTVTLSACGDPSEDSNEKSATAGPAATGAPFDPDAPLDEEQLAELVVQASDLDPGFDETSIETENDSTFECLGRLDDLSDFGQEPAAYDEVRFDAASDTESQSLFSGAGSYVSVDLATEAFEELSSVAQDCPHVRSHLDGSRWEMRNTVDEETTVDADAQINLVAEGTMRVKGTTYPVRGKWSFAQIGNNIVTVAMVGVTSGDPADVVDAAFEASTGRLIDLRG